MKPAFLVLIVFLSYLGFKFSIPPIPLLMLYGFVIFLPVLFILVKKNMLYALLAWFFFLMFKYGFFGYNSGRIALPLLPDIYIERIIWFALFFVFIAGVTLRQVKFDIGITWTEAAMFALCTYIVASMIIAGTIYKEGGQGLTLNTFLQGYAIPFSIFFLAKYLVTDEHKIRKVLMFFFAIGLYLGITGILEHFKLRNFVFPSYILAGSIGVHHGRARGPFLNAPINGTVIGIIILITIFLLFQDNKKWIKNLLPASILIMLTTLLFTLTRAVWLGFILSSFLLAIFIPKTRKIFFISLLILFVIVFTIFGTEKLNLGFHQEVKDDQQQLVDKIEERTASVTPIYGRMLLYKTVWNMFLDKPFFGFGFNAYQEHSYKYIERIEGLNFYVDPTLNVHDSWSSILVELGLVGLGLFSVIIISIIRSSIKLYRRLPSEGFISNKLVVIFWGAICIYFVNFQFIQVNFFIFANSFIYLLSGIIVGLKQRIEPQYV